MDRNEKIKYIAEYFGVTNQETKLFEECGELVTELARLQQKVILIATDKEYKDEKEINTMMKNVISELADVHILINQIIYLYDAEKEFKDMIEFKINRTISRIENSYYE